MRRPICDDTWTRILRAIALGGMALVLAGQVQAGFEECQPEFAVRNYIQGYNEAKFDQMLYCDLDLLRRGVEFRDKTPKVYWDTEYPKFVRSVTQEYEKRVREKRAEGVKVNFESMFLFQVLLPNVKHKVLEVRDGARDPRWVVKDAFVELTYQNQEFAPTEWRDPKRIKKLVVIVHLRLVPLDGKKTAWFIDDCKPLRVGMEYFSVDSGTNVTTSAMGHKVIRLGSGTSNFLEPISVCGLPIGSYVYLLTQTPMQVDVQGNRSALIFTNTNPGNWAALLNGKFPGEMVAIDRTGCGKLQFDVPPQQRPYVAQGVYKLATPGELSIRLQ